MKCLLPTAARAFLLVCGAFVSFSAVPAAEAEEVVQKPAREEAARLFEARKWVDAARAYKQVAAEDPSDSEAWFRLAEALEELSAPSEAVLAYQKADQLGFEQAEARYRIARVHARSADLDGALTWLERAVDAGFSGLDEMTEEPDFAALRTDSRFGDVLVRAEWNAHPCKYEPVRRQMSFWVGEWTVRTPDGEKAGTSSIRSALDDCLVLENWQGGSGLEGTSMTFYEPDTGQWRQVWVDSRGGVIFAEGAHREGGMSFTGQHVTADGKKEMLRMRLAPVGDGTVRQLVEQSGDGGETWYVWFEGVYSGS